MKIPFLSFKAMNADVRPALTASFEKFIDSNWYILGEQVKAFEAEYARFSNTRYCIGVGNGLDAIIIALKALDIGHGDEVIVPSNTYIATWLAVSQVGATPVPVEPRKDTCNIDPDLIETAITPKTKAILPVHLYGQCCEMEAIRDIATKHGLAIVEDNAQAQGATCNGQVTGSFGTINATSFYPGKNLGAYGDAGAITTDNEALASRAAQVRNYGSMVKYYNEEKGMNSRLDEMQAGFLSVKLQYLPSWNQDRNRIAATYHEQLKDCNGITLPVVAKGCTSVYHLYTIRTAKRDQLQKYLHEQGIGTMIHYPVPPHLQKAYVELGYKKGAFPIAEEIAATSLSLPIFPGLAQEEIVYITKAIQTYFKTH